MPALLDPDRRTTDRRATGPRDAGARHAELVTELPRLRELLLEQRRFRLEQLAELAEPAARHSRLGPARDGRDEAGHDEVAAVLEAGARHALADVEAALARIEAGSYGACLECGGRIGLRQLLDIPRVGLCLDCTHRTHPG